MATPTYKAGSFAEATDDAGSAPTVFTGYTTPALTNGYMFVAAASYAGAVVSVSQAGGSSLAFIRKETFSGDQVCEFWGVKNPTAVTGDVTVSWGGTSAGSSAILWLYEGVDQTTPLGTPTSSQGASGTAALTVTTVSGDLCVGVISNSTTGANLMTPDGGQAERGEHTGQVNLEAQDITAAGATAAIGATMTSTDWTVVGVALKGAGGAATPGVMFLH